MNLPAARALYDAHNHLQDPWLSPHRAQIFADLARIPLRRAVVNGTGEPDWPDVAALAREHAFILPSYGLHPWNVGNATTRWRDELRVRLDADPRAVLGEIGLDRWMLERARPDDPRLAGLRRASLDEQLDAFGWQLAIAAERNLPATIHCLDAWGALVGALQTSSRPARGFLLHAYSGSTEMARVFARLGGYFSFNGCFLKDREPNPPVASPKAGDPALAPAATGERAQPRRPTRAEVFRELPIDRLLVETDAPAMPLPAGRRTHALPGLADGNPVNHPANIGAAYAGLAEIRGIPVESLAAAVAANFARLFGAAASAAR